MKLFKFISLLLTIVMLLGLLLSCGGDNTAVETDDNKQTDTADLDGESTTPENVEEARIDPELPDSDFDGYQFNFLTHLYSGDDWVNETPLELIAEEETGEPINDAVYKRNMTIKEKYNVDIIMTPNSDERGTLRKSVQAGDSIYDAVIMFNNNVPGIVTGELLVNTDNLPYIDLEKPWWDSAANSMSIANKNYLLAGDSMILDNEATNALLFNKDLMSNLGLDLPYNLVKEGKWTMDVLNEYIKNAAVDLNGDGTMTPFDDQWGLLMFNDSLHALLVSGGGTLALKDDNDMPYITVNTPRNISVIDKSISLYNSAYTLNIQAMPDSTQWTSAYIGTFEESRALFMWVRMRVVEWFRGMEANFGILPMPKFDEAQENYHSVVNNYTGALLGVPKSADNLDRVSIILEAIAAESRYTLKPAYYDVVLTRKYTRDEESEEMLDIIFNSRAYDVGAVYSFGGVFISFIELAKSSDLNIASFYEKNEARMMKDIEKITGIFQEMD